MPLKNGYEMKNKLKDSNAPPRTRGTPVIACHFEGSMTEKSVTTAFKSNGFLSLFGMTRFDGTATARGTPVVAKMQTVARVPVISTIRHVMELEGSCSKEQISFPADSYRDRGRNDSAFRSTGRDGPPGSEMIPGAPAWLARGTPVEGRGRDQGKEQCQDRAKGPYARGKPPAANSLVISTREEERSATFRADCNRFLPVFGMTARGKSQTTRGHPPGTKYDAFHRAKLPEMGEICNYM
jgi:hypothetical protein